MNKEAFEIAASLANKLFAGVSSAVENYGPKALEMTLWVVRLEAIGDLMVGLFFLAVVISSIWTIPVLYKAYCEAERKGDQYEGTQIACGFTLAAVGVADVIGGIVACIILLNIWVYVGIAKPEVYLAKRVIDKTLELTKK